MDHDRPSELLLSYAELGERLGVSPDGARTRAKRSGWPVLLGNDGRAKVRVATVELPEQPAEQARRPPERPPERTAIKSGQLAELEQLLTGFVTDMRARASKAELEAEQARAALGREREKAIRLEAEQAGVRAVATADVEAARRVAEEAIAARDELLTELHRTLEHERGRADRLEAETRKPWWRRALGQ